MTPGPESDREDVQQHPWIAESAGGVEARVFTVAELAHALRIGRNAAYALVASGVIPAVRVGRSIRVPHRSLESFLDGVTR